MSAAPAMAQASEPAPRRGLPRYPLSVPLDVTTLRSGIPDTIPGRCTDLSEAGVGAAVAGELVPGQHVAIELKLPHVSVPLRARALVRHHNRLRCGLQFVGMSVEQREMIHYSIFRAAAQATVYDREGAEASRTDPPVGAVRPDGERVQRRMRVRRRRFCLLLAVILALAAFGWWQWQRAWRELEPSGSATPEPQPSAPLKVSSEVMESQILYKVDPVYPEAARIANTQGLVILDAIIASNGTVKWLRPVAGPDLLVQSALDAVQSWRFEPYRYAGRAVDVETTVAVEFRLK